MIGQNAAMVSVNNALVMPENRAMLKSIYPLGFTVQSRLEEGGYHLYFDLWEPVEGCEPLPNRCCLDPGLD